MKRMTRLLSISTLMFSFALSACGDNLPGKPIPEDLDTLNIIDDNYRNYYQILVGTYYDTNNDGVGDLNGVIQKLDYIKDTGFNGIWLLPIFTSRTYHKYDANDYYQIDKTYGKMADFQNLLKSAHEKGINVIIDLVLNHCGTKNPLYTSWLDAVRKYYRGEEMSEEENILKDIFSYSLEAKNGYTKVATVNDTNIYVEANFSSTMPEFNFDSDYVRSYFKDVIKYYIDMGVDGFRLDAVKYFYLNSTTKNCEVLSYFHDYAKTLKDDVYFVGECWDGAGIINSYYKNSSLESYFYFPGAGVASTIDMSVNNVRSNPEDYFDMVTALIDNAEGHIPAPFLDNHDMTRVAGDNLEVNKMHNSLLQLLNGSTFTYYGNEVGMVGEKKNGDAYLRLHFPWSKESRNGNCDNPEGVAPKNAYPNGYLVDQIEDPNSLYSYTKKALLLRNQNPEIARGEILDSSSCEVDYDNETYCYVVLDKQYNDSKIRIVINFSKDQPLEYDYSESSYTNVVGQLTAFEGTAIRQLDNKKIYVPPYGIALIK